MMTGIDTLCIEVTTRCPLQCVHCSALAGPRRSDYIPADALMCRLKEVGHFREIYLSGGEPFEHPNLDAIITCSASIAPIVATYSSGTRMLDGKAAPLPLERLAQALAAGLSRIDVSLYGADAETHDSVTTVRGSFEATVETIGRARSIQLPFGVHFVPVGSAAGAILAVQDLARSLGAERFHVLALAPQGRAKTRFGVLEPTIHFWSQLTRVLEHQDDPDLVVSSELRQASGQFTRTERDGFRTAFLDVRGFLYPGEGQQTRSMRSDSSILQGKRLTDLIDESEVPA